jgi:hypothetical protein
MLIKMTPAKTGTRQNFTVVLDQDEMAALVYQLQRAPLRNFDKKFLGALIAQVNKLWGAVYGCDIIMPPALVDG